jgi:hypothetical protein
VRLPGPRFLLAVVALAFLGYGAVLAWDTRSTVAVLSMGAVFLFFALVLPVDWQRLALKLWGASVEVERAKAAQETLANLPQDAWRQAWRQLVRSEELPPEELPAEIEPPAEEPAAAPSPPARPAREARSRLLLESLRARPAMASHEVSDGWILLRLKREAPATDADLAVACAIRKPGGEFLVGVPRLVGPTEPPMILGAYPRGGSWLHYEATFPDFFTSDDEELAPGIYTVIWGTLARPGGRAHVLATDSFEWPPRTDH